MAFFNDITILPDDPILSLPIVFAADPRNTKVNLGIGAYKTADGHSMLLTSVKKSEAQMLQKQIPKDYLPIEGDLEFLKYALMLVLGEELFAAHAPRLFATQAVGGSGALRIAGDLLAKEISKTIFLSQPSWPNHKGIFEKPGLQVGSYPYFDAASYGLDFAGMCQALQNMPPSSVILLHGCCHNPTGIDPTFEQWQELSHLIKKHQIIPLFDIAYQGFGQGLEEDVQAIRYFVQEGHEMVLCYSFSKNFGLYGERVGMAVFFASEPEKIPALASQVKFLIRGSYSTPPMHGSRIVATILKSHELTLEWKTELRNMRERVIEMRKALMAALLVKRPGNDFSYMTQQKGLFSFSGLTPDQVLRLRQEKAIYMPSNGRVNIAGLNTQNLEYVAESLLSVL